MAGRRRTRRFSIQLPAEVSLSCQPAEEARLCDLSAGGGLVVCRLAATFGTEIRIRFILAPDVLCEARGRVLRMVKVEEQNGIAFEFAKMNAAFEHFLQNLDSSSAEERDRFLADVQGLALEIVT